MTESKKQLTENFRSELISILTFWEQNMLDQKNGGFYGSLNHENDVNEFSDKGAVLNARILWSFSAAFNLLQIPKYLKTANRSFEYLIKYFLDRQYGGIYWSVDYLGKPKDTKKQIYAMAFTIYGMAEFYKASKNLKVLETAKSLFLDIEEFSFDLYKGGYFEAHSRNWTVLEDLRLSDKDANEKKTMNTHLHILEAYTNLYSVWPNARLKKQIINLLNVFSTNLINPKTNHMTLFFDENWTPKSETVSYGHDIEASWLMLEAAKIINKKKLINQFSKIAVDMAVSAIEGLDDSGGMNYEFVPGKELTIKEKHWWVQAEAMVGFLNAYQLSEKKQFFDHFLKVWNFIKKNIIDNKNGEWFWGIYSNGLIMLNEDKAGFWKCPYHNSRACMEVIKRLSPH